MTNIIIQGRLNNHANAHKMSIYCRHQRNLTSKIFFWKIMNLHSCSFQTRNLFFQILIEPLEITGTCLNRPNPGRQYKQFHIHWSLKCLSGNLCIRTVVFLASYWSYKSLSPLSNDNFWKCSFWDSS